MEAVTMNKKRCTECGEVKPVYKFSKRSSAKDGYQIQCKACRARYYKDNKKRSTYLTAKYYQEHKAEITEARISKKEELKIKSIYTYVDFNLHREIKREAQKYGMSVTQLLRGMIDYYFDNYKD